MIKYLNPIDQLFELNREVIPSLEKFEHPIIVVGGQALYYWINYYYDFYHNMLLPQQIDDEQINSIDIDYAARLNDVRYLPEIWNICDYKEAKDLPPPSLAKIQLLDINGEIKSKSSEKEGQNDDITGRKADYRMECPVIR